MNITISMHKHLLITIYTCINIWTTWMNNTSASFIKVYSFILSISLRLHEYTAYSYLTAFSRLNKLQITTTSMFWWRYHNIKVSACYTSRYPLYKPKSLCKGITAYTRLMLCRLSIRYAYTGSMLWCIYRFYVVMHE